MFMLIANNIESYSSIKRKIRKIPISKKTLEIQIKFTYLLTIF